VQTEYIVAQNMYPTKYHRYRPVSSTTQEIDFL